MGYPASKSKVAETVISFFLLAVLLLIAAGVLLKQNRFEQELFNADSVIVEAVGIRGDNPEIPNLNSVMLDGFKEMSKAETYDPDSLYEKINGKADLYLASDFQKLICQRFVSETDGDVWCEFYLYDMGTPRNAFAVFGAQRRTGAKQLEWTKFAYSTSNAIFLARGRYYIEIVGMEDSKYLLEAMVSSMKNFVGQSGIGEGHIEELAYFPDIYLVPNSFSLKSTNVFGFSELNNTFAAKYDVDGKTLTAFLSKQADRQTANSLAKKYYNFLIDNGAVDKADSGDLMPCKIVDFYGYTEIVFSNGDYIAGVHEADSEDSAKKIAIALNDKLTEVNR